VARAQRGDVWQVDMGIAGKVRPCLRLTDYPADDELAMVTVLPHTTAVKGNRWELNIPKPFLKPGAFHLQQIGLNLAKPEISATRIPVKNLVDLFMSGYFTPV
jgi:mRNA-degrading endonuclease toxin of MazEF toxin-antitoxin module